MNGSNDFVSFELCYLPPQKFLQAILWTLIVARMKRSGTNYRFPVLRKLHTGYFLLRILMGRLILSILLVNSLYYWCFPKKGLNYASIH